KDILKSKIKILDTEIKHLKYRLNAMEWERKKYLHDKSSLVKTFAMQALFDLAQLNKNILPEVKIIINSCLKNGSPSIKSRAKKLLHQL
ncbi:MAG: hypothetical protein QF864_10745, partial [SAR202 cluster bacterium]|nr:hypothetical protein [SAR202 cluster bacterium]